MALRFCIILFLPKAVTRPCSAKKLLLKTPQNLQKNTCAKTLLGAAVFI